MAIVGFICLILVGIYLVWWGFMTNMTIRLFSGNWFWLGIAAIGAGVGMVTVAIMNCPFHIILKMST